MTARISSRLPAYAAIAASGLVAGLALGRVEPVALAAPFVLALVAAVAGRRPDVSVRLSLDRDRALEGDEVTATRDSQRLAVGASPRGSIALVKLSRAKAALAGRDFVTPEDVKAIAVPALAHRLMVRPELWVQRLRAEDVVEDALQTVPTPPAEDALRAAGA